MHVMEVGEQHLPSVDCCTCIMLVCKWSEGFKDSSSIKSSF